MRRRNFLQALTLSGASAASPPDNTIEPETSMWLMRMPKPIKSKVFLVKMIREAQKQKVLSEVFGMHVQTSSRIDTIVWAESATPDSPVQWTADNSTYCFRNVVSTDRNDAEPFQVSWENLSMQLTKANWVNQSDQVQGDYSHTIIEERGGDSRKYFLLLQKPAYWRWAIVDFGSKNCCCYFAEKLRILDKKKGNLELSGTVISFDPNDVLISQLANVEIPQNCILVDCDESGIFTEFKNLRRPLLMEEIGKTLAPSN